MQTYNEEEVRKNTLKYFDGDELAATVWMKKYNLKNSENQYIESGPLDRFTTISREISRIESSYSQTYIDKSHVFKLLSERYLLPGGSALAGIGNNLSVTSLGNCFVISGNGEDSYGSILKNDEEIVQIAKRRGGVGLDISHLRPKGWAVRNAAGQSSGAISFMPRFSHSTREVAQDGRRGALMLSIHINHPDALDFILSKDDETSVTGANISVRITDDFMRAVEVDGIHQFRYPIDAPFDRSSVFDHPLNETYFIDGVMYKNVNAKELFERLVEVNWKRAEPGILFWDTIERESPTTGYPKFRAESTNPCFSGDERLQTINGYKSFKELAIDGDVTIVNSDGNIVPSKVWYSGDKDTIKLYNSQNESFICTPDHIWQTIDGEELEAKDLKRKRLKPFLRAGISHIPLYVKLGFIQGDGNLTRLNSDTHKGLEINIGKKDDDVLKFFGYKRKRKTQRKFYTTEFTEILNELKFDAKVLPERGLPETIFDWSNEEKLSFLSGLFSANGSIVGNYRISFKSTNINLILGLQELLKEFGINSYYTTNKAKLNEFANGTYQVKESYDLNIGRYYDLIKFYDNIKFIHKYKNDKLKEIIYKRSPKITKIVDNGVIPVYDFIEPENNWGVVNGYVAHNCGEIPLSPYDSCRLLSINLTRFVIKPFTKDAFFDYDKFNEVIRAAVRIMDNIVDLEIEKLIAIINKVKSDPEQAHTKATELNLWQKILETTIEGRRVGISLIGHGDMFAMLGMRYGDEDSFAFAKYLHKIHAVTSYETSVELADERGAFPAFNADNDGGDFLHRIDFTGIPRRNIALLTIPPSGSLSILFNNQSSGIEPVFALWYERSRKVGDDEEFDYIDKVGDKWKRYPVFHRNFVKWAKVNDITESWLESSKETLAMKSPYYGSTSHEIDPLAKVRLQGTIQQYVDHSISMTTNLPETATQKDITDVYFEAWKHGCKGATIYRDGSRSGVLNKKEEPKEQLVIHDAPKRPRELPCDIYHPSIRGQRYVVMVGIMDDKPYEVFALKVRDGFSIPTSVTTGIVRKQKSKHWQVLSKDREILVENIIEQFEIPEYGTVTKLASLALRTGAHVNFVIKVLNNNDGIITDYAKVIARQLKRYAKIEDNGTACPICGEPMVIEGGCKQCKNPECGYSACG